MIKYLLDTNTCIYVMKRKPVHVKRHFNINSDRIAISSLVYGELIVGAEKSIRHDMIDEVEDFVTRVQVLDFDKEAARHYGHIRAKLEAKGVMIGSNDALIAAHARSKGLILVTSNVREFSRVDGLQMEDWKDGK